MKTRSRLPVDNTSATRPGAGGTADTRNADELLRINELISQANKLRKSLNDVILTTKKTRAAGSKKLNTGSKPEQEIFAEKFRNETQSVLKNLEYHRLCLTGTTLPVTPFDLAGSKAMLDDIHARYLEAQNINEPGPAVLPDQSKPRLTGQGKTKASKTQVRDGPNALDEDNAQQMSNGVGPGEGKSGDADLLTKGQTSVTAPGKQPRVSTRSARNKRTRGSEDETVARRSESSRKKIKQAITKSTDTPESDLTPFDESSDEKSNTHLAPPPTHLSDETLNPINPSAGPQKHGEDVEMLNDAIPEPIVPQAAATSTTAPLAEALSGVVGGQGAEGVDKVTVAAAVPPNPGQTDVSVETSTYINTPTGIPTVSGACVETSPSMTATGDQTVNKVTEVTTTPLPGLGDWPDKPLDEVAEVASGAVGGIVADEITSKTTDILVSNLVSLKETRTPAEKTNKKPGGQLSDDSDSVTTDDNSSNSDSDDDGSDDDSTDYSSDDENDSNIDGDGGEEMRLVTSGDIIDLEQITKKKTSKKESKAKKVAKASQRDTLRIKWDSMTAKRQKEEQDKAMKQIRAFLQSPSTRSVPINTRAMIREVAEFCVPACHISRELALHILKNKYKNLFCIFHQKIDKAGRINDCSEDAPFRVTGTPFPRLVNEKPKKMYPAQPLVERHEGYLHCGCSEDEALLEFYWWKTAEVTSPATGKTEGWLGHRKLDPRTRTLMFGLFARSTHMRVDDIYTGDPLHQKFDDKIKGFDTKIARLEAAKAQALEEEATRIAGEKERRAKKEARKARKKQRAAARKDKVKGGI